MAAAIHIENIGKQYRIGSAEPYLSMRERLTTGLKKRAEVEEKFWALKDVSFDVGAGDRIGVIGRNGAGKSTLLKILSRITPPTKGKIIMKGRLASLLEVGTGFHPELTGMENIYFNGSILGLRKKEIDRRRDEIIDFSGIERFINTPLKHYSSGMQLRLAFSVAAHLEPEILLIDEVLAVGDMEFQKKCMGKMEEVSRTDGRTIIFVSHNMSYIASLCNKAVLLDRGSLIQQGSVTEVVNGYMSLVRNSSTQAASDRRESDVAELLQVKATNSNGEENESFPVNEDIYLKMKYRVKQPHHVLWLGYNIHNESGVNVFDTHSVDTVEYREAHGVGDYEAITIIPGHLLNTGAYFVSAAIFNHLQHVIHFHHKDILLFHVHDVLDTDTARGMSPSEFPGIVRPLLQWKIKPLK